MGLPTLSVKFENRRQVFVESKFDEAWYQALFDLLRNDLNTPFSLTFIAAAKERGSNSSAVIAMVNELRNAGNDSVWGLIDRDDRQGAPAWIEYNPMRYAIENLVLDPLLVGAFLIRERVLLPEHLGLTESTRFYELHATESQAVIDAVVARVRQAADPDALTEVGYRGDFTALVPSFWMNMQGHALEERLKAAFPELKKHNKNLLTRVISDAMADAPQLVPAETLSILRRLVT